MEQEELERIVNDLSIRFFHKPFIDKVSFNNRLRTTGGRYIPSRRTIELNPKYLMELGKEEFYGIIKHELCHYHLHIEGKGYKHRDPEFRELLRRTNSPRFCQPLPSQKTNELMYKYKFRCVRCNHTYNRRRMIDTRKYRCGKCNGEIKEE
ncbi:SprT family protein [Aquibacillus koreensis]|uniref:Protein SprT-like n=1 Tax=Aquibacillus koreensis TaxID=279446 RepID=A0A9X3WP30_9BACI|nr:SprT family protein [Aquibacillus koreensis]MCT2534973.1 SprT family protein [Aquibacillus koreensis]MDC3422133.1 SprT family protein [Aquibacillus koreensis]